MSSGVAYFAVKLLKSATPLQNNQSSREIPHFVKNDSRLNDTRLNNLDAIEQSPFLERTNEPQQVTRVVMYRPINAASNGERRAFAAAKHLRPRGRAFAGGQFGNGLPHWVCELSKEFASLAISQRRAER